MHEAKRTEVYFKFGQHLLVYLSQRHGTLKNAASLFKTSPQMLSHIIHGRKKCPDDLRKRFLSDGFPEEYFIKLEGVKDINNINTFEDLKFLYLSLFEQYKGLQEIYREQNKRIEELKGKFG